MDSNVVHIRAYGHPEDMLREHPLFALLTDDELHSVKKITRNIQLKQGETLFLQGDKSQYLYLISKGLVKLFRQSKAGQEKIFDIVKPGDVVGETSIFHDQRRYLYSSSAVTKSTVISINSQNFLDIIKNSPDALMASLNFLSQQIHGLIDEVEQLSLLTGNNRLALYLYDQFLERGESFSLGINKKDLASILALTPETFSRLLRGLCTQNIISLKDWHIKIIDETLLKELAYK